MSGTPAPAATPVAASTKPTVETFIDVAKAAKDVSIDAVDFSGELDRQSGLVYYYTAAAARAERQVSNLKLRLEATEAARSAKHRSDAAAAGTKITVDELKAKVRLDKTVVHVEQALIEAQEVLAGIKGICEALRHKRDMLVMRGHMTRDELKAQMDVAAQHTAPIADGLNDRDRRLKERLRRDPASEEA